MDIRRYFGTGKGRKQSAELPKSRNNESSKTKGNDKMRISRRSSLIIDSDSDESPIPPKKLKPTKRIKKLEIIEDSDEDQKATTSNKTPQKKNKAVKKERENNSPIKGRLVTPGDYFGEGAIRRASRNSQKQADQAHVKEDDFEIHDDDDFKETLKLLDDSNLPLNQKTKKAPSKVVETKTTNLNDKPTVNKKDEKSTVDAKTPLKALDDPKPKTPSSSEKKANYYMHYLHRGGPRAPGSKEIPQGADGCFEKMTFVITGVLDSLEREEAVDLIKKYGGKVTQSISKNTTYVVIGQDAGPSKLEKANKLKIRQLDEDGLLDMLRTSAGKMGRSSKCHPSPAKVTPPKVQHNKEYDMDKSPRDKVEKPRTVTATESERKSAVHPVDIKYTDIMDKNKNIAKESSNQSMLWVDKYKPVTTKQIIGQQGDKSNVQKLKHWLENWKSNHSNSSKPKKGGYGRWGADDGSNFKAALLSGPPGVGKTTSAQLVCKELNYSYIELNASDTRSKKNLQEEVARMLQNKSLTNYTGGNADVNERHCLLMDEVDGMAGNEDRGGVQELIQLIKKSKIPIICMCNDRMHQKIRSLSNYCFDLRFQRPRLEQLKAAMMSLCFKEDVKITPEALQEVIIGANQDVRQIIHHLSLWSVKGKTLSSSEASTGAKNAKKDVKLGPFDVLKMVFSASDHKTMSIHDKSNLFFHDYSIAPLFVQENYINVCPLKAKNNESLHLDLLSQTADSICDSDLVEKLIRSEGHWGLLPVEAMFASVIPGDLLEGYLTQMIAFPSWLGRNSTKGKNDRLLQELHMHTKLKTSGCKTDVNLDYLHCLVDAIVSPLSKKQHDGISSAVTVMCEYNLMREDLDAMLDLYLWPKRDNHFAKLNPQVKAAFTRALNKEAHLTPYVSSTTIGRSIRSAGESVEEEYDEEQDEIDDDVAKDAMIKKKVAPKRKAKDDSQPSTSKKSKPSKKGAKK